MKARRRFIEIALLVAGIGGVGIWGWSTAREGLYEDWNNWIFDRQQTGKGASVADYVKDRLTASKPAKPEETVAPAPLREVAENGLIGRLSIPRLDLHAMVREGTGEKTLSLALGHIAGTATPGQNGNVGVAGHRDSLFRGLRNIKLNDRIVFETSDGGTYVYQVTSTRVVKPTEVSVLNAGLFPELTLVTCYPFNYIGSAPDRFIVKARQVGQVTRDLPATEVAQASPPAEPPPAAPQVEPSKPVVQARGGVRRVPFEVSMNHSRQLAPGISIGLTRADAERKTVDGWMWVMPERRTIWLRDQSTRKPIVIYGSDGWKREIVIDSVTRNSMRGYLVL
jgi:LPXTG-site transpeptidase (sortase) family protein